MALEKLSDGEKAATLQCLTAILQGPFIEDFEFQTRLGVDRAKLRSVIEDWPNIGDREDGSIADLAIGNCFNELCNGLDIPPEEWTKWFTVSKPEVEQVWLRWTELKGLSQA